jgi:predicted LPLAT superfamily acyltransferase
MMAPERESDHNPGGRPWTGVSKGSARGNRIFLWLIAHCGRGAACALLLFVSFWYALTDRDSIAALCQFRGRLGLRTGFIDLWRHFFHFGASLIDTLAYLLGKAEFAFTGYDGRTPDQIVPADRGSIIISAHFGNWEVAGNGLSRARGLPVNVIMLDNERQRIKALFGKAFTRRRIRIIPMTGNALELIMAIKAALDRKEIVCMHGDRCAGQRCEAMDFFGRQAFFPRGPFELSAITGVPLLPVFAIKQGLRTYRLIIAEPIPGSGADREAMILSSMRKYVSILQDIVRAHPFEWFNFYDFWADKAEAPLAVAQGR